MERKVVEDWAKNVKKITKKWENPGNLQNVKAQLLGYVQSYNLIPRHFCILCCTGLVLESLSKAIKLEVSKKVCGISVSQMSFKYHWRLKH